MIVKHPFLRNLLVDDIDFKKSQQEEDRYHALRNKQKDEDSVKKCPKCRQNYIPSKTSHGYCHYHNGFIWDLDNSAKLTIEQAQEKIQKAKLDAANAPTGQTVRLPKLVWACCLGLYGSDPPCQVGSCGLPEQIDPESIKPGEDYVELVRQLFMNSEQAQKRLDAFLRANSTQHIIKQTKLK
ncbi:unnamed protein product [Rotaria sp. Silwood2]|nr:unnamed protein product [Rotaria sp. Silwood2]CAF4377119.1 unnamed protein product [Rotaria sp. Silwood2]